MTGRFGSEWVAGLRRNTHVDRELELLKKIKPIAEENNTLVIGSMGVDLYGLDHPMEFAEAMEKIAGAGADLVEVIPFCPYVIGSAAEQLELTKRSISTCFKIGREKVKIPVIAKFPYEYQSYFEEILKTLKDIEQLYIHLFNRYRGTIIDIEEMKPIVPGPMTLIYGGIRKPASNRTVALAKIFDKDFQIVSTGGIWNSNDCIERLMCGATLVGAHTAIQYHGKKLFKQFIDGISEFLERKKCKLGDIVGVAAPLVADPRAYTQWLKELLVPKEFLTVEIDYEKCTACWLCANCIHEAIVMKDNLPIWNSDSCERCGICESICPVDAITVRKIE